MAAEYYNPRVAPYMGRERKPFTDNVNQPLPPLWAGVGKPATTKFMMQDQMAPPPEVMKKPASPPLPRQNAKIQPPSPPKVIKDAAHNLSLTRVGFLGEGGFARVYEVEDADGTRQAVKVVTKDSLKTKKAKTKLYAEIKIHRSLTHPHIVRFLECFDDEQNVYMTLELCQNGSLMDMLRRRRCFTEPEARYFTVQLLGACHYMHTHQVIHRDLKLGNIFLDVHMNVKVGDFGLAALIENPGERKKTICGTPNYIAPEVLFDTANGHSFEVDTWSVGVILYTLVIGKPPFQTKDVKTIYKRIRDNEYTFPPEKLISDDSRELITQILLHDPEQRPSIKEILNHSFYTRGLVPASIPVSAQDSAPYFHPMPRSTSLANLARLRKKSMVDEASLEAAEAPDSSMLSVSAAQSKTKATVAQQEREFQKAVQPGSPISALLSSARQPLVVSTNITREQPLIRKLQTAAKEKRAAAATAEANALPDSGARAHGGLQNIVEEDSDVPYRNRELESQKARIVAQMVPGAVGTAPTVALTPLDEDTENQPPVQRRSEARESRHLTTASSTSSMKQNGFDAAARTLTAAFEAKARGKLFRDPREDVNAQGARVFIVSWVDYCNKYGMGYALTDGSVGVYFNDSTSIVLAADKQHFEYITSHRSGSAFVRKCHTVADYPIELKSKVYLLKHFEKYIMENLYGEYSYAYTDLTRTKGMDFVQKYLRMKHVIVFKMSHDVIQFNFYDHTKVVLSSQGLMITYISKDGATHWSLSEIMALALDPTSVDPAEAKFNQRLVDKLKYCKEVLLSIKNASNQGLDTENFNGKPNVQ